MDSTIEWIYQQFARVDVNRYRLEKSGRLKDGKPFPPARPHEDLSTRRYHVYDPRDGSCTFGGPLTLGMLTTIYPMTPIEGEPRICDLAVEQTTHVITVLKPTARYTIIRVV